MIASQRGTSVAMGRVPGGCGKSLRLLQTTGRLLGNSPFSFSMSSNQGRACRVVVMAEWQRLEVGGL